MKSQEQIQSPNFKFLGLFLSTTSLVLITFNKAQIKFFFTFRRMQTVTNYYISALALSDVVLALFCIPFQFRQGQNSSNKSRFKNCVFVHTLNPKHPK